MIQRLLKEKIVDSLKTKDKVIILYGPRRVGKTTLANTVLEEVGLRTLFVNGDESKYTEILSSRDLNKIKSLVSGNGLIFIDEAQRIPEIGINLKIMIDGIPNLKVLATGSSSLDLASKISEPLTGRAWTYTLYPISYQELSATKSNFELDNMLEERLVFGSYPEIFATIGLEDKEKYLTELTTAYLYRDALDLIPLRSFAKVKDLLKLLAFQVGSEVSLSELGSSVGLNKDTVSRYIDILEKSFVLFRVGGFSRNLRKEVTKMDKIYFWDCGVRNAIIENFKPLTGRNDSGQLWENFLISERIKKISYSGGGGSFYFWRTYTGAEVDFVEELAGKISAYEYKFSQDGTVKVPEGWKNTYPEAEFKTINKNNYLEHIL